MVAPRLIAGTRVHEMAFNFASIAFVLAHVILGTTSVRPSIRGFLISLCSFHPRLADLDGHELTLGFAYMPWFVPHLVSGTRLYGVFTSFKMPCYPSFITLFLTHLIFGTPSVRPSTDFWISFASLSPFDRTWYQGQGFGTDLIRVRAMTQDAYKSNVVCVFVCQCIHLVCLPAFVSKTRRKHHQRNVNTSCKKTFERW